MSRGSGCLVYLLHPADGGGALRYDDGPDLALAACQRALEPKKLQLISGGHFAPYLDQFPLAVAAAIEWFSEHLLKPRCKTRDTGRDPRLPPPVNSDIANV
jgi:hypothetical protein